MADVERQVIAKALDYFKGNKTKAAEALDITEKTIYNKLERYAADDRAAKLAEEKDVKEREAFDKRQRGIVSVSPDGHSVIAQVADAYAIAAAQALAASEAAKVHPVDPGLPQPEADPNKPEPLASSETVAPVADLADDFAAHTDAPPPATETAPVADPAPEVVAPVPDSAPAATPDVVEEAAQTEIPGSTAPVDPLAPKPKKIQM